MHAHPNVLEQLDMPCMSCLSGGAGISRWRRLTPSMFSLRPDGKHAQRVIIGLEWL
jgi:hypothetical protein